jgi:hypothetical protein
MILDNSSFFFNLSGILDLIQGNHGNLILTLTARKRGRSCFCRDFCRG